MDQKGLRDNVKALTNGISKIVHYLQTAEADPTRNEKQKVTGKLGSAKRLTSALEKGKSPKSEESKDSDKKDECIKDNGAVNPKADSVDKSDDNATKDSTADEKSDSKSEMRSPLRNVIIETEVKKDPFLRSLKKFYGSGREESARVEEAFQEANKRLVALVEYCGENKNTQPDQVRCS